MTNETLQGRRILVAGGTGLVGANLVQYLHRRAARVRATYHVRQPPFLPEWYVPADFTTPASALAATQDVQDVVLCAGFTSGIEQTRKRPTAAILPNVVIPANLLEAARLQGVEHVIVLSSSTVYPAADHPIAEDELDLNEPPHEAYLAVGHVNRFVEQLCQVYRQRFGLRVSVLRPSNIYGPYDHFEPDKAHVLPALIRRALAKEDPFRVWGSPHVVRDFIYVDDVVDAIARLLQHDGPGPLNLGCGEGVTIGTAVQTVLKLCGHEARIEYDETKPTAIAYRVLDRRAFDALFPGALKTPLAEGLRRTIAWYCSQEHP